MAASNIERSSQDRLRPDSFYLTTCLKEVATIILPQAYLKPWSEDGNEVWGAASKGEIMRLCGRRTRSMFDRCNIIDEADLVAAVAKWFEKANATPHPQGRVA